MPVARSVMRSARVSMSMRMADATSARGPLLAGSLLTQYWAIRNTINTM